MFFFPQVKKKRNADKDDGKDRMTAEMKKLKKEKEMERLYQREERKLFLGGLSLDTVR